MTIRITILLIFLLSLAAFSSAEIYKYRDANGVLRFTDNLQEVPKDQRPHVESYIEIKSKVPEKATADTDSDKAPKDSAGRQAAALQEEKALLDTEFAQLEAEKKTLVEASEKEMSAEEEAAYQKQVQAYNARVKAYEENRKVFSQKVKEFNASLK
jgi:hypothetical protein